MIAGLTSSVAASPGSGVLVLTKYAEMSLASASLSLKSGIVVDAAYAWGSLSQLKIHSRVVLSAM